MRNIKNYAKKLCPLFALTFELFLSTFLFLKIKLVQNNKISKNTLSNSLLFGIFYFSKFILDFFFIKTFLTNRNKFLSTKAQHPTQKNSKISYSYKKYIIWYIRGNLFFVAYTWLVDCEPFWISIFENCWVLKKLPI